MKLDLKEYFKLSIIYTIVAAVTPVAQFIIQPFIEGKDRLNEVDFSHIAITESISALAFIVIGFAMSTAVVSFYYDYEEKSDGIKKMVATAMNSILVRGTILMGLALMVSGFAGNLFTQPELQDFTSYGFAAVVVGISRAINVTAAAIYRNEKNVKKFIVTSLAYGLVRVGGILIGLFFYEMSFLGYLYGSCVGGGIVTLFIVINTIRTYGFSYDRKVLKPMLSFAWPLMQYNLVNWGLLFIDRYFLESTPASLGIYDTALKFAAGIEIVITGLHGANQPEMFRLFSLGIKEHAEEIKRLSNIFVLQVEMIFLLAIFPAMIFIDLVYETELHLAMGLIAIVFVRFLMRSQYIILSMPLYYMKVTKAFLYLNILSLVINIGLNYWLIPIFDYYGAIAATLIANFVLVGLLFAYQKKKVDIKFNYLKIYYVPNLLIAAVAIIEVVKLKYELNPYLAAGSAVGFGAILIATIYRTEVVRVAKKYIGRNSPTTE